jgi:hypothetical protein
MSSEHDLAHQLSQLEICLDRDLRVLRPRLVMMGRVHGSKR